MNAEALVPIVTALVAAIPPTLVATAALMATLRQRRTLTETQVEVGKVHTLVNSEMTAMKADLAASKAQIDALLQLITKLSIPAQPLVQPQVILQPTPTGDPR